MTETAPIFIRTASKQDLDAVQNLLKNTWHDTYDSIHGKQKVNEMTAQWHDIEVLNEKREQPLSEFIVADTGSKIVGMAFAAQLGKIVFLHQLYVSPSEQRSGVGKEMLQELFYCFDSAEKMALEVDAKNVKAIAFYEQNEFVKAGETDNCGSPDFGIKAFVYERLLQE